MFIASWDDPTAKGGLATQADTQGELESNIREATGVHFDEAQAPDGVRLHFTDDRQRETSAHGTLKAILRQSGLTVDQLIEAIQ
jgi:hypothetical protein